MGDVLDDVIPMFVANLDPEKDPEVRLKFFSLLSRLMLNSSQTLDSQNRLVDYLINIDIFIHSYLFSSASRKAAGLFSCRVVCRHPSSLSSTFHLKSLFLRNCVITYFLLWYGALLRRYQCTVKMWIWFIHPKGQF